MIIIPSDVNIARVLNELDCLSKIGKSATEGITRLTFDTAHQQAVNQVAAWMEQANLNVTFDQWGNLFGFLQGEIQAKTVYTGSHLDSVPAGGNYDGPLGVLASLEAIRIIREKGIKLQKNVEVVSFIDEEGSRFRMHLGSGLAVGMITKEEALEIVDASGKRYIEALAEMKFPYPVEDRNIQDTLDSYIELHIEQGKRLEKTNTQIGIVTCIAGVKHYQIDLTGRSDHAGTTDYEDRHDALLASAELILKINKLAREKYVENGRITVSNIYTAHEVINVVAGDVTLFIDSRAASTQVINQIKNDIDTILHSIQEEFQINYELKTLLDITPVEMPTDIQEIIAEASVDSGIVSTELISWASHDAQEIAYVGRSGMMFVPCVEGRSHCPEEYTLPNDIPNGIATLANAIIKLADGTFPSS